MDSERGGPSRGRRGGGISSPVPAGHRRPAADQAPSKDGDDAMGWPETDVWFRAVAEVGFPAGALSVGSSRSEQQSEQQ